MSTQTSYAQLRIAIAVVLLMSQLGNTSALAQGTGGLAGAWALNEIIGTTIVDSSGNGRAGTVSGATIAAGRYGQGLSFDGTDFVTLGDLDMSGPFTLTTWWQTRSLQANGCSSMVMKALDYGFEICQGRLYAGVGSGTSWSAYVSHPLTNADLNAWRHAALTYDGTTLRLYVGGTLITSATGSHTTTNNALLFGRWSQDTEFWDGLIDEVRVYSRALTANEIQADMNLPISDPEQPPPAASFQNDIVISNLNLPTNIEFLPDGSMLIGELGGKIQRLPAGATQLQPTPFLSLSNIGTELGQQGLMDIELDPDFGNNAYYYVFYTLGNPNRDRVSRFTANVSLTGTIAGSEFVVWQDTVDAHAEHHGGDLTFATDGRLYITVGDHFDASQSQPLTSYHGKILRLNKDGTIPIDNPFHDGAGPNLDAIWARGLRNPFRASFDAVSGTYYISDVGGNVNSTAVEELNVGVAGANYGWPICEGACAVAGMTNPLYSYPHAGRDAAIVVGFVYRGNQFPAEYVGSLFYADYTQNWIRRLTLDATGNVTGSHFFEPPDATADGPYGDIVHLTEGPDGALYYTDLGFSDVGGTYGVSKIRRISYAPAGNLPPVAVASANPTTGLPPLTVSFSSAGSSDPDAQPLSFLWNLGDGSTSAAPNPTHTYTESGQYTVVLSVSDGTSTRNATPLTITVGNPPQATILGPLNGSTFRAGQEISFSGAGTDPEDGNLPASAFSWVVNFHHSTHVHPTLPLVGTTEGSIVVPTSGHDFSGDTRYEIRLTVTDSAGLQNSSSIFIFPEKVDLTFDTVPSGRTLKLDGISRTAPFVYDSLIGFAHTIEAENQSASGNVYTFTAWSDGGAQAHTITVPISSASYTASFNVSTPPPPASLVGAWAFNEGSGATLADSSGNALNGAITGATWTPGKYGQALNFDGNDLVTLSDIDLAGPFTLMVWMQTRSLHASDCASLVMKALDYGLEICAGRLYAGIGSGSNWTANPSVALTSADLNVWKHVALAYDGTTLRFYIDGTLTDSAAGVHGTTNNALLFGRWSSNSEFWDGLIDEVRIYSRALSDTEIQTDRNTPVGSVPTGGSPTLVNPGNQTHPEGALVSLQLSASDPDSDPIMYSATGLPPGLTVGPSTGVISGLLDFTSAGTYNASVTATAAGQTDTKSFQWTVTNTNRPPSLVNPGDRTNAETATVALQVVANDTDQDVLTYAAAGLPPGLTINPLTGNIAGTIQAGSAGAYTVTVGVSDGALQPTATFTWTVAAATTAPVVTMTSPAGGATVAGLTAVRATATDDVAVLGVQFLLNGNPLGSEDLVAAYELTWNTATVPNGSYMLSARARDAAGNAITSVPIAVTVQNTSAGLVAAWGFNEGTGSVLGDSSGNGRTGAITGATWTAGKYGQALNFDGNDLVTLSDIDLTGPFTVMVWMQTRSLHASGCASLVMKALDYGFEICDGVLHAGVGTGSTWTAYPSVPLTSADLNLWKHAALTYDGTTLRLYVDGTLADSAAGVHGTTNNALRFGRWSSTSEFWNGLIDEVRIYSRALPVAEIQTDLNTPVGGVPTGGPPTLLNPGNQTHAEGTFVSLPLSASDPDGDPIVYSATGLPSALTVNSSTGVISGTLTFTSAGTYNASATATAAGQTDTKSFQWTVTDTNQAPAVNAGADQTVTLPSGTTLTATVTDDGQPIPPGALTLGWTRVSGPGTVTFSAPTASTTNASFSAAGTYVLRLTASDGALSTSDDVTVTVAPIANTAPTVDAGADRSITLPSGTTLIATVTDDGQPNPPGTLTLGWSRVSGPGTVTFSAPNAATTNASFSAAGTYVLRLAASDGALITTDDVTVTVAPAVNAAPTVDAGADRSITLPSGTTLIATVTDDGQPNPPGTLTLGWTRVSGPGTVTFSAPTASTTNATFSAAGTYVLRLTASDGALSTSDDVTVTVAPIANTAPTVDAGADRSITLPSGTTLIATVTDDGQPNPPGALTLGWTRVSGPGTVTFSAPTASTTNATFSAAGTYVLRLTASDGALSTSDDVTVTVAPIANTAPTVDAGADRSITLPSGTTLIATVTDDGQPNPPGTLTLGWSRVSGPGTVTFSAPNAATTNASFSAAGTYVLRLAASDGALITTDDVTVTVAPAVNAAPTVDAGADRSITLPSGTTLIATVTDDGQPNPPGTLTLGWSRVSGPGTVTFSAPNAATTNASFSAAGTYVLRLAASDGALITTDDVTVTVAPAVNAAPTVDAGADRSITLPSGTTLIATVTDDGQPNPPGTLTLGWSRVSGPGTVTFSAPNAATTNASFSAAGTYVLRLAASDGALITTDDVTVTVAPAVNTAPTVNAGADQTITLPNSASLSATVSDDGLPTGTLNRSWTRVSGPGTVTFSAPTGATTSASFSSTGAYVLRLTVSDGALSSSDDVAITVNLQPALVGAWNFNEGTGTVLGDVSGNGRTGAVSGATWTTGKYGQALNFDGNDVVTLTDLDLNASFTVMVWMQTRSVHADDCASLVMKSRDYGFEICDGRLYAGVGTSSGWTARSSVALTSADLNVWKHVALTYDGTTLRFYVDGALVGTAAGAHSSGNNVLRFGRWSSPSEFWNGLMDDVRIYSRALSQTEVQTDMSTPIGN